VDTCYEVCGDDYQWLSLECEDFNTDNYDGCSSSCEIEDGWYCLYQGSDPPNPIDPLSDYTTSAHDCYEICGDNYDFETLGCEDGDTDSNDGCSSSCEVEEGWYCTGGSATGVDTCYEECGDGLFLTLLDCDDDNNN